MTGLPGRYTLADIDRLARIAVVSARTGGLDSATCHGLAWSAIAEALLDDGTLDRSDLVRAGRAAIHTELAACLHARGYQSGNTAGGPGASPRFAQYWRTPAEEPAVDRMLDHLAAVQVGALFTAAEGAAVEALAVHEDHQRAADALGVGYTTLSTRLSAARRRFREAWFAPDTAPPVRTHDRRRGTRPPAARCGQGHPLDGDNLRIQLRRGGKRERVCRACERARGAQRRAVAA